jgi:hypothetical protein
MRKWTKRIGLSLASLVLCSALATTVLTASTHLPGNQTTPAGFRQYSSGGDCGAIKLPSGPTTQ